MYVKVKGQGHFQSQMSEKPIFITLGVIGCNVVDVKCHISCSNFLLSYYNNYVHTKPFIWSTAGPHNSHSQPLTEERHGSSMAAV